MRKQLREVGNEPHGGNGTAQQRQQDGDAGEGFEGAARRTLAVARFELHAVTSAFGGAEGSGIPNRCRERAAAGVRRLAPCGQPNPHTAAGRPQP